MELNYHILFSVALKHNYFSDNKLGHISIVCSDRSAHDMTRNGLLFKPHKDGFTVLYNAQFAGRSRERKKVTDGTLLRFYLKLNDAHFFNYTSDFEKNPATGLFYFHNLDEQFADRKLLHKDSFVSDACIRTGENIRHSFFNKPFGLLDIKLSDGLEQEYEIRFAEKKTYWRYHLVSEHLKTLSRPAILRDAVFFEGPVPTLLPDKRQALTFVSPGPIALFEFPKGDTQLVEKAEGEIAKQRTVMQALPTPNIRDMSRVGDARKDRFSYSEIFI